MLCVDLGRIWFSTAMVIVVGFLSSAERISQALPPQASAWARIVVGFTSLALAGAHQPGLLGG